MSIITFSAFRFSSKRAGYVKGRKYECEKVLGNQRNILT